MAPLMVHSTLLKRKQARNVEDPDSLALSDGLEEDSASDGDYDGVALEDEDSDLADLETDDQRPSWVLYPDVLDLEQPFKTTEAHLDWHQGASKLFTDLTIVKHRKVLDIMRR